MSKPRRKKRLPIRDDNGDEQPESPFKSDEEEERFCVRLAEKIGYAGRHERGDFRAVLSALLGQRWEGIYFLGLSVTTCGRIVATPQVCGADLVCFGPKPLLGLCLLSIAFRCICRLAEEKNLSAAERAFLLNRLPH